METVVRGDADAVSHDDPEQSPPAPPEPSAAPTPASISLQPVDQLNKCPSGVPLDIDWDDQAAWSAVSAVQHVLFGGRHGLAFEELLGGPVSRLLCGMGV